MTSRHNHLNDNMTEKIINVNNVNVAEKLLGIDTS